jgi:hypothetical protein
LPEAASESWPPGPRRGFRCSWLVPRGYWSIVPKCSAYDFAVLDELATISGADPFLNFTDEPLVVVHQALDGLDHQRLGIAASLGRKLREFGLQIGVQTDFHGI